MKTEDHYWHIQYLTKNISNVFHELFQLTVDNISISNPDEVGLDITFYTVLGGKNQVSPIPSDSM